MLYACAAVCSEQRRLQQLLHECDALCVCGCHHVPVDLNSSTIYAQVMFYAKKHRLLDIHTSTLMRIFGLLDHISSAYI